MQHASLVNFKNKAMSNYKVKYIEGIKMITLLRNILAALVYEETGLHEDEAKVLYDLLPQMVDKAEKDEQFRSKHGDFLIRSLNIISKMHIQSFPYRPRSDIRDDLKQQLYGWLPSSSAYFGWSRNPLKEKSFKIIPQGLSLRIPKTYQKRFLGVGYKDKGNKRNLAEDASPSWQEVSATSALLSREREEDPVSYRIRTKDSKQKTKLGEILTFLETEMVRRESQSKSNIQG
jgi:hypothetical protein